MENKKMKTNGERVREIMAAYLTCKMDGEEAAKLLDEIHGAPNLATGEKEITVQERKDTMANMGKGIVTGVGLVNNGTGYMDKIHVTNGKPDESGLGYEYVDGERIYIADKVYTIPENCDHLVEVTD